MKQMKLPEKLEFLKPKLENTDDMTVQHIRHTK